MAMKNFSPLLVALIIWGNGCLVATGHAENESTVTTNAIPNPEYHGKSLSYWLEHLYRYGYGGRQTNLEAQAALFHAGSNAVPLLVNWISKSEGGGWSAPDYAVEGFEILGPIAKLATPDLIKIIGLNQQYPERALVFIGKDVVPQLTDKLVETLSDTNNPYVHGVMRIEINRKSGFYIRDRILGVLNQLGTNAEAALPALIQTVTHRFPAEYGVGGRFQQNPYGVLARVGRNHPEIVVPILLEAFTNSPKPVEKSNEMERNALAFKRGRIIEAMSVFGTNQAGIFMPVLIAALTDNTTNDWSRVQMSETLTEIASNQTDVLVPVFLSALTNSNNNEHIRCGLAGSLVKIARNQPDIVVPALITAYTNSGIEGRSFLAGLLAEFGDKSRSMVPALIQDSWSKDLTANRPDWKIALAVAAKKIDPENTSALSALIGDFENCDAGTKQRRLRAFGELGGNGADAVPVMLKFLTNDTTQVRCDDIEALNAIGVKSDEYIHNLSKVVSDTNVLVSQYAQSALCSLAANSQLAFEATLKYVVSAPVDRDEVQTQAIYRLAKISSKDPESLVKCLGSSDPAIRSADLVVFHNVHQCVRAAFNKLFLMSAKEPDAAIRTLADVVYHQQLGLQ